MLRFVFILLCIVLCSGSAQAGPRARDLLDKITGDASSKAVSSPSQDTSEGVRVRLSAVEHTVLSSEIPAKIIQIAKRNGESFDKDEVLFLFDCAIHRARLKKALAEEKAAIKAYQINKRLSDLETISTLEFDKAAADKAKAAAEVELMQAMVDKCAIKAPFSGRVADLYVREHAYVGNGVKLAEIINSTVLELELVVPSRWLSKIKVGSSFSVNIDETGEDYPALVTATGPGNPLIRFSPLKTIPWMPSARI